MGMARLAFQVKSWSGETPKKNIPTIFTAHQRNRQNWKCTICQQLVMEKKAKSYGHYMSDNGLEISPDKVTTTCNKPGHTSPAELGPIPGMANYSPHFTGTEKRRGVQPHRAGHTWFNLWSPNPFVLLNLIQWWSPEGIIIITLTHIISIKILPCSGVSFKILMIWLAHAAYVNEIGNFNRKCQDYVYIKMRVLKYYVENKTLLETWK